MQEPAACKDFMYCPRGSSQSLPCPYKNGSQFCKDGQIIKNTIFTCPLGEGLYTKKGKNSCLPCNNEENLNLNTYSAKIDSLACQTWSLCNKGEFLSYANSQNKGVCQECPPETYQFKSNHYFQSCLPCSEGMKCKMLEDRKSLSCFDGYRKTENEKCELASYPLFSKISSNSKNLSELKLECIKDLVAI